jgi:colicin import membrane protein
MNNALRFALPAGRRSAKKMLNIGCLLGIGLLSSLAMADGGPTAAQQADWDQRLARAAELQQQGAAGRAAADQLMEEQTKACYKKFLVNRCRATAHDEYVEANKVARRIQNEGKAIERQVKKEQLSAKDLKAAAEMPEREAELQVLEAETTAARNAAAAEEEATRVSKARKAEEGAKRKAEEAQRLQKKQADHEARVAEQNEKAAAKAAKEVPAKP